MRSGVLFVSPSTNLIIGSQTNKRKICTEMNAANRGQQTKNASFQINRVAGDRFLHKAELKGLNENHEIFKAFYLQIVVVIYPFL